jgi:hypothetical protein
MSLYKLHLNVMPCSEKVCTYIVGCHFLYYASPLNKIYSSKITVKIYNFIFIINYINKIHSKCSDRIVYIDSQQQNV